MRSTVHMVVCMLVALTAAQGKPVFGQNPQSNSRGESTRLTQDLVALAARYRTAVDAERTALTPDIMTTAARRRQLVLSLMETDPQHVLAIALPSEFRAALPSQAQANIEQHVTLDGSLEILNEDYRGAARLRYALLSGGRRLALHFAADPPGLLTGDHVRVRGVRVSDTLALESGQTSVESLAPPPAGSATFGEQRTLVMLVNFQDKATQPYSIAHAENVAFTTTSNFDRENSQQQTWMTGDVFGWFTIAMNSTVCDTNTLATLARNAATASGLNLSLYSRHVYAFPQNACTWWGQGTVGGNPSQAWINGDFELQVLAHEMGHNLGLYHAHSLDCGTSPVQPPCTTSEYGDTVDMMGGGRGHYNSFMKERLGWLGYGNSPPLTTVSTSGSYWLEPFSSAPAGGAKALKVLKSVNPTTGAKTWYYMEFRQPVGFDAFLSSYPKVINGVVIHTGSESSGNSNYLLDMTPETTSWFDPALPVGRSFTDAEAGITITAVSIASTGASVSVQFGGSAPCTQAAPSLSINPTAAQSAAAGAAVRWTATVRNNDTSTCAIASFDINALVPAGWSASVSAPLVTLMPGESGSSTIDVTSPSSAADGFYTITMSAARGANTASATGTYVVSAPPPPPQALTATVTTDKPSYVRNDIIRIRVTFLSSGSPLAGVRVSFQILKANGATTTLTGSGTTDSTGIATATLKLSGKLPFGTWSVQASGAAGAQNGTGTTSFEVR